MSLETAPGRIKRWREGRGILQFVDEEMGVSLDAWQEKALLAIASPKVSEQRVSLQACAGPGKTAVLAWGGCWFLGCQGEAHEHPKGAAVSVTRTNLDDNLWTEYAKWIGRSQFMRAAFTWTHDRIFANDHPNTWFLSARSWPKTASADVQGKTLSGLHSKYVLAQIDESGDIPTTVLRAGEQALSTCVFGKLVQAGNPISLEGMLYAAATVLSTQWVIIRITGDPDDPEAWVHSPRVGPRPAQWAAEQIAIYGRENPWVKAYILGQFPPASINALLGVEDVQAAQKRHLRPDMYDWAQKRIGVDVARFGDDLNVLFPRQGLAAFKPIMLRNVRTTAIAARTAKAINQWGAELTIVDDTGHWGHGVVDQLMDAGYPVIPVIYSDPAINPRYFNRRAEMWLEMADWVKGGGALPPTPELLGELTVPTYTFRSGKFLMEEKDQIKARLGRSPNYADALAQTFAIVDQPAAAVARQRKSAHVSRDRDPYNSDGDAAAPDRAARDTDPLR